MTAQGLDSHAVPHPTRAGMWAIEPGKPEPVPAAETKPPETGTETGKSGTAKALAARAKALRERGVRPKQIKQAILEARAGDETLMADLERINAPTSAAPEVERRVDVPKRKSVDAMSADEMRKELLTNHLTGIPNKRAYEESKKLPVQVSIDADSLKWVNDTIGHQSGDEMLKAIAQALADETPNAYHVSGDEFIVQAIDSDGADTIMKAVADRLGRAVIAATKPDGTEITIRGLGVSDGTGPTLEEAESRLQSHKESREQSGERAARGEKPPGATISSGGRQGREDNQDHATAQEEVAKPAAAPVGEQKRKPALGGAERIRAMADRLTEINPQITGTAAIKTARYIARAIDTGEFNDMLHPDNKTSRKLFEEITGSKLPAGVKATREMFTGKPFQKATEDKDATVKTDRRSIEAAKRFNALRRLDTLNDSLFPAIAKLGGLNWQDASSEWGLDPKDSFRSGIVGLPVIRKNGGRSVDGMAELLAQRGYLDMDEDGKWDLIQFGERFRDEAAGSPQYTAEGTMRQADLAEQERELQAVAQGEAEQLERQTQWRTMSYDEQETELDAIFGPRSAGESQTEREVESAAGQVSARAPTGNPATVAEENARDTGREAFDLALQTEQDLARKEARATDETVAAKETADREREAFTLTPQTPERTAGATAQGGLFTPDAGAAEDAKSQPSFVKAPDGSIDFGEFSAEQAKAMRRQAGKIRLENGNASYGLQQIEERHGEQIRSIGFKSVE